MIVLVPSCYAFRDTWRPWGQFRRKYWPDCPYPCMLLSDGVSELPDGFDGIIEVVDQGWCANLGTYLSNCEHKAICLVMDDMWIAGPVDTDYVQFAFSCILAGKCGCLYLHGGKTASEVVEDGRAGVVAQDTPYRISACPAVWGVGFLQKCLCDPATGLWWQSPWEWEIKGTLAASSQPGGIWSCPVGTWPLGVIYTAVTRGRWTAGALDAARREGVEVDTNLRTIG